MKPEEKGLRPEKKAIAAELDELGDNVSEDQRESLREDWANRHRTVLDAGGLRIIGTERHESRRDD